MSVTTKLLTILMLVLSAAYAAVSAALFAKRQDFKSKYEKTVEAKDDLEQKLSADIANLRSRSRQIEKEKQAADAQIGKLEDGLKREQTINKRLEGQVASRAKEVERLLTMSELLEKQLANEQREHNKVKQHADKLDKDLTKTRDTVLAKNKEIEGLGATKAEQEREIAKLNTDLTGTKKELGEKRSQIKNLAMKGFDVGAKTDKAVTAQVIKTEGTVVVINRGRGDGVRIGADYSIYSRQAGRGYVGKLRIKAVENDLAYGSPIQELTVKAVQVGDTVSNTIR